MPRVAARPRPFHLMRERGAVKPLPVIKIGFALEKLAHRLDDILRIGDERDAAWLLERFKAKAGRDNLGLLIGQITEVLAEDFARAFVFEHGHGGSARF